MSYGKFSVSDARHYKNVDMLADLWWIIRRDEQAEQEVLHKVACYQQLSSLGQLWGAGIQLFYGERILGVKLEASNKQAVPSTFRWS